MDGWEDCTLTHTYEEVHVFDGIAERTGVQVDRAGVRGGHGICRSVRELGSKARRMGDGYYYLAASAWPVDRTTVDLNRTWVSIA